MMAMARYSCSSLLSCVMAIQMMPDISTHPRPSCVMATQPLPDIPAHPPPYFVAISQMLFLMQLNNQVNP